MQQLMMLSGIGLVCWLMMRGRMQRRRSVDLPVITHLGHNANAFSRSAPFTGTQSLGAPTEVLRWQVELHDLARELKAELDSKMIAVRSMTTAYDQAARRLAELIRLAEQVQLPGTSPLVEARRLANLDWENSKIAAALCLPEIDVAQHLTH